MTIKQVTSEKVWRPLGDRVMLKRSKAKEEEVKTPSGIYIPDSVESAPRKESPVAEIIDISSTLTTTLKVGDKVLFSQTNNDVVKYGGVEYILAPIDNIIAVQQSGKKNRV